MAYPTKKRPLTLSISYKKALASSDGDCLLVGAAKIDITPPIGMPMSGYATMSTDSTGVRTRLMARVFYLKPKIGPPLALVQCDLLSGSLVLHHRVAELIAEQTDVDCGGLLIAGTHTHSGPGNYFASMFYNNMASNRAGFDPSLFEFLSQRIASAVIESYQNRRAAKIATGSTRITGVAWNRSLAAYLQNENISLLKTAPDKKEAVNPFLHMIRVDCLEKDGSYKPIGAFSNFSLHPNTNPAELGGVYSGDVFGFAEREMEWLIKKQYKSSTEPVHALANYTHGDNNPDYAQTVPETFQDLKKFGIHIAHEAFELFKSLDSKLKEDVVVRYRSTEIDVFKENMIDGIRIAKTPAVGMSTLAGAQGRGRTSVVAKLPFFAPGWPKRILTGGEHGQKRRMLSSLQGLILPKDEFPHHLFLQVIQVDDTILLPLPFEVTYEIGTRIAAQVERTAEQAGLGDVSRTVVAGVSNGYWGYVTTPEEYSLQYYEGGSNFYGPNTGAFLAAHIGHLVEQLAGKGCGAILPDFWEFKMQARDFVAWNEGGSTIRESVQEAEYHDESSEGAYWSFKWHDSPAERFDMHKEMIQIEVQSNNESWEPLIIDNRPINDAGYDMSLICLQTVSENNTGLYEARWYAPNQGNSGQYRFAVLGGEATDFLYSSPFIST